MAKLTIETRTQIPQDAVNAITHYFPLGPHGQPVRKDRIGHTWVECGTLTLPQVVEMLGQFGISVERIRRDQGPFADQVIFDRRKRETQRSSLQGTLQPRQGRNESSGVYGDMNQTVVLVPKNRREKEERKGNQGNQTLFNTARARESFTARLTSLVGETRGKALAQATAFVSDTINHFGSEKDPRRVYPWHLVSIKTETDGEAKKSKISLKPLDDVAPKIAKAIWDYIHALERGRVTVEEAFQEFEDGLWQAICPDERILDTLKNLSDPKHHK